METIAKLIKVMFFLGDDPDKTAIQKFKDLLLTAYIIITLLGVGLYFWSDDEDVSDDGVSIENVDE